ncbi:hypothetical protein D3C72_1092140 [compost metagenome]
MIHGEIERLDPGKIIRIQRVLRAHPPSGRRTEISLENTNDRFEDVDAGHPDRMAPQIQELGQLLIDDGIEDDTRLLVDEVDHLRELFLVSDHRIDMFHRH